MSIDILIFGTCYVDLTCTDFPFNQGLLANKETVGGAYELETGGSALNFAQYCTQLGLKAEFIGKVGNDPMQQILRHLADQQQISTHFIVDDAVQTNVATHYVRKDGVSVMSSCGSANQSLSYQDILAPITRLLPQTKYLYLGGCFKLKAIIPHYTKIITLAQAHTTQVVIDHGRVNNTVTNKEVKELKNCIAQADIYLPSRDEFLKVWGEESIEAGIKKVAALNPKLTIVVKDSANGAFGWDGKEVIHVPAKKVKVHNTVGAGDSFNAAFVNQLAKGSSLKKAIQKANEFAGEKISNA